MAGADLKLMKLKELQRLAEKVSRSNPRIRYNPGHVGVRGKIFAHVHTRKNDEERGTICFSWKGFNRSNPKVLLTLAHELAHLKYPMERHSSRLFSLSMREFYLDLARQLIISKQIRGQGRLD